jgi:anaerobic selenocysteine-containing dehydrogenase
MNEADMTRENLKKMDVVNILSNYEGQERKVFQFLVIPYSIPKGNLAAYFPETNPLIPIHEYADKSNTPISKSVRVSVEKAF